jgi:hypothetical protein
MRTTHTLSAINDADAEAEGEGVEEGDMHTAGGVHVVVAAATRSQKMPEVTAAGTARIAGMLLYPGCVCSK